MARPKITVVGAGQVGATTAQLLLLKNLADIVLIDVIDGLAKGKALDLLQAAAIERLPGLVTGTTEFDALAGSQLVVITAGLARKPGMSRDDLLAANAGIVGPIADRIARLAPDAIVIVVTNPLDVMTWLVLQRTKFPKQRVIGMAGELDTGRLRAFIAERLRVEPAKVEAMVLGSHGDMMVSLKRSIAVGGEPLDKLMTPQDIEQLIKRTRDGGAEIVSLLKTSSAYYAPAAGVAQMVGAILHNERRVIPCSVRCDGEYGIREACIGVPVALGKAGVTRIVELPLAVDEREALQRAAAQVREMIQALSAPHPTSAKS